MKLIAEPQDTLTSEEVSALIDAFLNQRRNRSRRRTISIVIHGPNQFDVFEGEQFVDHLCWDEMLGQIVHLTHPDIAKARYDMGDVDYHQSREERHRQRMAEWGRAAIPEDFGL